MVTLVLLTVGAHAAKVEVACPAVGDVARYNVILERSRTKGDATVSLGTTTTTHRLEVVAVEGAILKIQDRAESGAVLKAPSDRYAAEVAAALTGLSLPPVVLVVDTAKETVDVPDVAPLTIAYARELDGVLKQMVAAHPELPADFSDKYKASVLDPVVIRASLTKSFAPLARYACQELAAGMRPYPTWIANTLAPAQIRADGSEAVKVDGAGTTVTIREVASGPGLEQAARELAQRRGLPDAATMTGPQALAALALAAERQLAIVVARGERWPETWSGTVTQAAGGTSQVETVRAERQAVE